MKKITLENGEIVEISDESYNNIVKATTPSMPWRAEDGKPYWYVDEFGIAESSIENHDSVDRFNYAIGNYYRTEEETEKEANRRKALGRVRLAILEANDGWEPDWDDVWQAKFEIVWDNEDNEFWSNGNEVMKSLNELPYIASEEVAMQIIEDHEEDLKRIFGVE